MARPLGVPKSVTDRMGWWSVGSEASDGYIRTYRSLIARVQEKVACTIRSALEGHSTEDTFGEEYVLEDLKVILVLKYPHTPSVDIETFIASLRTFECKTVEPLENSSQAWWEPVEGAKAPELTLEDKNDEK